MSGTGTRPMADGSVQVRIVSDDPEAARQVARVLRERLVCDEPRSYPTGDDGEGIRLHLTVDTLRPHPAPHTWLTDSRSQARRTHADETAPA
ncbi:hypothetical protein [Streptomyces sp. AN091965]|uniref:hypothetical protein n=1 Tax=Streptomyces sp. AN091965 TaxID=2927803 RepID=UPI001F60446C|nr:hypothetical protein [Streptomyces sp. AN091965]MCI3928284.1 hypothetical protein [Streptomyces sp. AN091965]